MDLSTKYSKTKEKKNLTFFMVNLSALYAVVMQFFITSPSIYSALRIALYLIVIMTFLSAYSTNLKSEKNPFSTSYFVLIYLTALFSLLISLYTSRLDLGILAQFAMPYFMLFIGFKSNMNVTKLSKLVLGYMIFVTFFGLFMIFVHGNGFHISEIYLISSKNQIGPIIASVALMSFISLFISKEKLNLNKFLLIVLFVINLADLIVLRNRSGLVALAVCLLVFFMSKIKLKKRYSRNTLLIPLIITGLAILITSNVLNPIFDIIYNSFTLNYNTSDLNSLSANRTDVYMSVLQFLKVSPFFGEVQLQSNISETPHNFLLNLWLNYGILGMLPVTIFYISIWLFVLYKTFIGRKTDISLYLLLFMLVISMFEYTYPFGPLSTVSFSWILLGNYLNNENKNKHPEIKN